MPFAPGPSAADLAELEASAKEARDRGETPIIDGGYLDMLTRRAEASVEHPLLVKQAVEQLEADEDAKIAAALTQFGLNYGDDAGAIVRGKMEAAARERLDKQRKVAEASVAEHEARLRQVLADVEVAESALNRPTQFLQRWARLPDSKVDTLSNRTRDLSEAAAIEMIRQASAANDMAMLSALYVKVDGRAEWKDAQRAMAKAPCGDLERHQKQLGAIRARAQLGLDAIVALKVGRKVSSTARIAAGLAVERAGDAAAA